MNKGKVYKNLQEFQSGIQLSGQTPLDDRTVLCGLETFYISTGNPEACPLYGKVYSGMTATFYETETSTEPKLVILKNATPYTPGEVVNVNVENYLTYWQIVGKSQEDFINGELTTHLNNIDASIRDISTHIANVDDASIQRLDGWVGTMDSSVQHNIASIDTIDASLKFGRYNYYDAAFNNDNTAMLTAHGNLPKGTKVSDLKNMTISHILSSILFEVAEPVKKQSVGVTIAWASGSKYASVQDVSVAMPTVNDLNVTYKPEIWNWTASDGQTGTAKNVTTVGTINRYFQNDDTLPGAWAAMTTKVGSNGPFYATATSVAGSNAVDSNGSDKRSDNSYYRKASDAATEAGTQRSDGIYFTTAWRYYSNASKAFTKKSDALAAKTTAPSAFRGNDNQTKGDFITAATTLYLQWPKLTGTQHIYVYVPNAYKIASNACNGASDTTDAFNVPQALIGTPQTVEITNDNGAKGTFKKYEITPMGNISTIEIKVTAA